MLATLEFLGQDESAAAVVEYGILIALVALVALAGIADMGQHVSAIYDRAGDALRARHH